MTEPILEFKAGDVIFAGLKKTRKINVNQPVGAKDAQNGLDALNVILKHWQTQGFHLWQKTQAILPLVTGQSKYLLGPSGDNVAKTDTFVNTSLSSDTGELLTIIELDSVEGIEGAPGELLVDPVLSTQGWTAINDGSLAVSSGIELTNGASGASGASYDFDTTIDNRYVVEFGYTLGTSTSAIFDILDTAGTLATVTKTASGTFKLSFTARDTETTFKITNGTATAGHTSTVSSLQVYDRDSGDYIGVRLDDDTRFWSRALFVTSVVELADGLPSDATEGNTVYSYEENIERPQNILGVQFSEDLSASELPVEPWSRVEYFDQPDKASEGTVVNWYYSPQLGLGDLRVWQSPANSDQILRFTYERPMYISSSEVDSVDIPSEWVMPLQWAIAKELMVEYGVPADMRQEIKEQAAETLSDAKGNDEEKDSLDIIPDVE